MPGFPPDCDGLFTDPTKDGPVFDYRIFVERTAVYPERMPAVSIVQQPSEFIGVRCVLTTFHPIQKNG